MADQSVSQEKTSEPSRRVYAPRLTTEARRELILDAALRLFDSDGAGAVSMEALARAIDISKPVIYRIFPNVAAVFEGLLLREELRTYERLEAIIKRNLPESIEAGREALSGPVTIDFLADVRTHPAVWRLLLARDGLPSDAIYEARQERRHQQFLVLLGELIEPYVTDRPNGPLDPDLTARLIVTGLGSAARLALEDDGGHDAERVAEFVSELVRTILYG